MDAPRVKVGTGDTKYITFILPIISGSFSYLNLDEEPETVEIKDWKLAFKVRVDYRTVGKEDVPQEVWERVNNLGDGMFSMRQLFMDFQTANFAELDLSESVVPKSVIDSGYLAMYMKRYFAKVTEDGHNILGYAVQVHNPNQTMPECPSFPPTDLTFATHRYEDGTSTPNPDYDTLTYLLMTRNRPMPLPKVLQNKREIWTVIVAFKGTQNIANALYQVLSGPNALLKNVQHPVGQTFYAITLSTRLILNFAVIPGLATARAIVDLTQGNASLIFVGGA